MENQIKDWISSIHLLLLYPQENFWTADVTFLKNIVDYEYATVVLYLSSQNEDLKQCVNVIRKTERDLAAKRSNRRKLKTLARRIKKKRKKKEQEYDLSLDESDKMHQNTPKIFKGVFVPKPSGLLGLNEQNWKELSEDKKKFIQGFNAKVNHGEDTNLLIVPPGLTIKIDSRPQQRQEPDKNKNKEKKEDQDQPPKKRTRKLIGFSLELDQE